MSYSAMAIGVGHSSSKKPMTTTRLSCAPNCQVSIPRRTWWSRSSTTSWSSGLKDPSHTGVTATTFIEARFDTARSFEASRSHPTSTNRRSKRRTRTACSKYGCTRQLRFLKRNHTAWPSRASSCCRWCVHLNTEGARVKSPSCSCALIQPPRATSGANIVSTLIDVKSSRDAQCRARLVRCPKGQFKSLPPGLRAAHHGRPRLSEAVHGVEVHPSTVLEPSERGVGQPVAHPVPVHGNDVARSQVANETNTTERATHHFESFGTETQA